MDKGEAAPRAFEFHGHWREFAGIAFTNLLLTIVTLGVYLFWARARERRYLWSQTRFIDDRLEWTGTGLELFLGYVIAILVIVVPLWALQMTASILITRGEMAGAFALGIILYLLAPYLIGLAVFRGLRYRLSRTFWHGIRGGTDQRGLGYALANLWRMIVAYFLPGLLLLVGIYNLTPQAAMMGEGASWQTGVVFLIAAFGLSLLVPWSQTSTWNLRWGAMSFGPYPFGATARYQPLIWRFLLYYLLPIVLLAGLFVFFVTLGATGSIDKAVSTIAVAAVVFYLVFFVLLGLVALFYYAAFYREAIRALSLGELEFEFDATTFDWFRLMVVNTALVIFTLGIGAIFLSYRNWRFFIRHLNAYGNVDLLQMTQSETRRPGQGEGLLDAFDMGAF
ncbi:YjgN family protein [Sphingomonas sp.]|uniref:YjgN family protein n=1 Tax=Sphingomonas sp. TaxID=28214 RepID=UPI001B2D38C3|nr:YjgN family protein [Sphingomonas sp.]MBO9713581.1 DUF898 domain-containing protein [Sphingomonas sp.]